MKAQLATERASKRQLQEHVSALQQAVKGSSALAAAPAFVKANVPEKPRKKPGRKAGHLAAHRPLPASIDEHIEVPLPYDGQGESQLSGVSRRAFGGQKASAGGGRSGASEVVGEVLSHCQRVLSGVPAGHREPSARAAAGAAGDRSSAGAVVRCVRLVKQMLLLKKKKPAVGQSVYKTLLKANWAGKNPGLLTDIFQPSEAKGR